MAPVTAYTVLALAPPPHRLRRPVSGCAYGQGGPVDRRDGADSEDGVDVRGVAGRLMVGVRSSARSGSVVLAPPPSCLLKSPHALLAPEYRLALQVGSVPTPRVIMQAVFPWRQGTPCGDRIASVKFSQPERLQNEGDIIASPDTAIPS